MRKTVGMRRIGGHNYYIHKSYATKAEAKKEAARLHKQKYGARTYKVGGKWIVYTTDTLIHLR